jgi:type IX secretion system PorP/SprF family membrane protein
MKKNILFVLLLVFEAIAQDFHLSLYDFAPLHLNPAMTGVMDSKIRVHGHYRNQWNSIATKPFQTMLASLDLQSVKRWSFGGQLCNMRAGVGNYNVAQFVFSAGYFIPLDKMRAHNLSFGLQAGLNQKRISPKLLTYDSQWTNSEGGKFDTNLPSGENFSSPVFFHEVVNFGLLYYYGKQQSRFNPFIGISAFNLTQPKETFVGSQNRLPLRLYFHVGSRVNVNELLYFIPKVLIMKQVNNIEQTYALDAGYYFKSEKFYLLAGLLYRNQDAGVGYIGFRKDSYIFKVGYDVNISSLKPVSRYRGAFEIGLTWLGLSKKAPEIRNCPRL